MALLTGLLGVVVGLTAEARFARPLGGRVVAGGGTAAGAEVAVCHLLECGVRALLSFGLAGGLDPALRPGAVIVPEVVVLPEAASRHVTADSGGFKAGGRGRPSGFASGSSAIFGRVDPGSPGISGGLAASSPGIAIGLAPESPGASRGVNTDGAAHPGGSGAIAWASPGPDWPPPSQPMVSVPVDFALATRLGGPTPQRLLAGTGIVASAAEKRRLWEATGAAAIDLESGAVAAAAKRHGLPFAVLRVICDPAERNLPDAALAALDPTGGIRALRVLGSLARQPNQLPVLLALASDAAAARRALTARVAAVGQISTSS